MGMRRTAAAEGPIQDWVHVLVDGIPYCVHHKRAEVHYEGKEPNDLDVLMHSEKHRKSLADRGSLCHKESGGDWTIERPDSWKVNFGNKSMKITWEGHLESSKKEAAKTTPQGQEWISAKIKYLMEKEDMPQDQAIAVAHKMAKDEGYKVPPAPKKSSVKADANTRRMVEDMAQQMFGKGLDDLQHQELAALMNELHKYVKAPAPTAPAPGAAPVSSAEPVRWLRNADENPFANTDEGGDDKEEKEDGEKDEPEEKKDDKKEPPKEKSAPKKKKAPKKKEDDEGDSDKAETVLKLLEDLIGEGGDPEIDNAMDVLRKFLGKDSSDMSGGPPMPGDMPGMPGPGGPGMGDVKVKMTPMPGPSMPVSKWVQENKTGLSLYDRVWSKAAAGVGIESGRVIAFTNDKVVVDWGDDVPTEEDPASLKVVEKTSGEESLFSSNQDSEIPEGLGTDSPDEDEVQRQEAENILSGLSLGDMLAKHSDASDSSAVVHVGTGRQGSFIGTNTDGRIMANFDGTEGLYWPYEIHFANTREE